MSKLRGLMGGHEKSYWRIDIMNEHNNSKSTTCGGIIAIEKTVKVDGKDVPSVQIMLHESSDSKIENANGLMNLNMMILLEEIKSGKINSVSADWEDKEKGKKSYFISMQNALIGNLKPVRIHLEKY